MRRLLYVPIIHSLADMGSAGRALAEEGAARSGSRRWRAHEETLGRFWESVASYLLSLDPRQFWIYQDGLAAEGEVGRRVVEEAAARGSPNYRLVRDLLDRGAQLRQAEDLHLLWQEREGVRRTLEGRGTGQEGPDSDRSAREGLLKERDAFIGRAIAATLREGEVGVLFIGAEHDVPSHLPPEIAVEAVKDQEVVRAYFEELLFGRDDRRFEDLGRRLAAPVSGPSRA